MTGPNFVLATIVSVVIFGAAEILVVTLCDGRHSDCLSVRLSVHDKKRWTPHEHAADLTDRQCSWRTDLSDVDLVVCSGDHRWVAQNCALVAAAGAPDEWATE